MMSDAFWKIITPSRFEHERRAMDFIRAGLPDQEPFRAWSNFEFHTDDGGLYEVDLLVLTREGFWLVEVKSRPGRLEGDVATWTWTMPNGRRTTDDNPYHLANRKAKVLKSQLERTTSGKNVRLPYLEALVFLSEPDLDCQLVGNAGSHVCLTDRTIDDPKGPRPGILAALLERRGHGIDPYRRGSIDVRLSKALTNAVSQAGIRPSQRERRVGDYVLRRLLFDGPGYQDWEAEHSGLDNVRCRARQYLVARAETEENRKRAQRNAEKEFRILEALDHPGILPANDFRMHEYGPVLTFRYDPSAVRLDHFLASHGDRLSGPQRMRLLRQLADALRYAQTRRIIHRALSPQSVLVFNPESDEPTLKIFNWQLGMRENEIAASNTTHVAELVEDQSLLYIAPEALITPRQVTPAADVFSLGTIAFRLFAGRPPALSLLERDRQLLENRGFVLEAVLDNAGPKLCELIRNSTHPDVGSRTATVEDFLLPLDEAEKELAAPGGRQAVHPEVAEKGDTLEGDFVVDRVLGQGSTGRALLVHRDGDEFVLKVARSEKDNERLRQEGDVLRKLRSEFIVGIHDVLEMQGRIVLVLEKSGEETLAAFLRDKGNCTLELLERFGEQLLIAVEHLEERGVAHRDIKPDNIAVRSGKQKKQLVLFDFSLSREPLEAIRLGTAQYIDPFLLTRRPPRWDTAAERYSLAVTLYEMAAGWQIHPKWGDGQSDPSLTDGELVLEPERFDASVRESMSIFFRKAFQRDPTKRFDNAEQMKRAWLEIFREADRGEESGNDAIDLDEVRLDTPMMMLNLSARARNALERLNIASVRDFLRQPLRAFQFMRGVGKSTSSELLKLISRLRERFPDVTAPPPEPPSIPPDVTELNFAALRTRLLGSLGVKKDKRATEIREMLVGLRDECSAWGTQNAVADRIGIARQQVSAAVAQDRRRWHRDPAVISLRNELVKQLFAAGGVCTSDEAEMVLLSQNSFEQLPEADRKRVASALARIAIEAESIEEQPRMLLRRTGSRVMIVCSSERADQVQKLAGIADELAAEDPLPSPQRCLERLQSVPSPALPEGCVEFGTERLCRLAVAISEKAALSPRMEIYPHGMSAQRALRLSVQAISGIGMGETIKAESIRQRIAARYPAAEPLPDHPLLDEWMDELKLDLIWVEAIQQYRRRTPPGNVSSGTLAPSLPRSVTSRRTPTTPAEIECHTFEERMRFVLREGGFLVLSVKPGKALDCEESLPSRFGLERMSLDGLLIKHLKQQAEAKRVKWSKLDQADNAPHDSRDWQNLIRLVGLALPEIEAEIASKSHPVLLVHPGLLARYDAMELLERLRDRAGKRGECPCIWLLVAGDEHDLPTLDGREIPLLTSGQRAKIPHQWQA